MINFSISPSSILGKIGVTDYLKGLGVEFDDELIELITLFSMRFSSAPNKTLYLKETLRRALNDKWGKDPSGRWHDRPRKR